MPPIAKLLGLAVATAAVLPAVSIAGQAAMAAEVDRLNAPNPEILGTSQEPWNLPPDLWDLPPLNLPPQTKAQAKKNEPNTNLILQVDGVLEEGDNTFEGGYRLDFHPFQGQAGQTVTMRMTRLPLSQTVGLAQKPVELEPLESGSVKQVQTPPDIASDSSDWDTTSIQPLPLPPSSLAQQVDSRQLEAIQLLHQADQLSSRGELEAAISLWEQALALFRAAGNRYNDAQILGAIGVAYKDLGQYEQAIALHQQAMAIAIELNDLTQQVRALNNLGVAYRRSGETQMAIDAFQSSLALARRTGDIGRQLNALGNLGNTYRDVADYQQAINIHEEALSIAQQNNRGESYRITIDLASSYNQAGNFANENGNYQQAIILLQKSLDLSLNTPHQSSEDFDIFNPLNNLGIAYRNLGYYQQALDSFQQSIDIARNNGDPVNESLAIGGLSSTYGDLGNLQLSLELQKQSLSLLQEAIAELSASGDLSDTVLIHLRRSEGRALGNLGAAYLVLGDYQQAAELYEQRLAIARELNDSQGAIFALNALGDIERNLGRLTVRRLDSGRAGTRHEEALAIARSLNNPLLLAQTLVQHSESLSFFQYSGVSSTRIEYLEEALAIYRANGIRSSEANILMLLGRAHLSNDQPQRAESRLMEAIQILNDILVNVSGDADRISLFETQLNTFALLQQALADQNDFERSLVVAEQGRARALVTLLSQRTSNTAAELSSSPAVDMEAIKRTAQQTNSTLVAYSIIRNVDANYERNRDFGWHPQSGYSFNYSIYMWVVSPDRSVVFRELILNGFDLEGLIANTRDTMGVGDVDRASARPQIDPNQAAQDLARRRAETDENLRQLHEILISPIADLLPADPDAKVAFIPQGELFLVPFPALKDANGQYLIENHTILTAPSIQVLQLTHDLAGGGRANGHSPLQTLSLASTPLASTPLSQRALIVGDPAMPTVTFLSEAGTFDAVRLQPLYGARQEAQAVGATLNAPALLGADATEARIKQQIASADLIHLATHGLLEYGDPRQTGSRDTPGAIALAPGSGEDGLLTATEILQMELQADLVVLSACDTGRGRITGDGVIGLSRAFIATGVPSIIVSLWAVPDAPTADLMSEFYTQLAQGQTKAQALRQAMLITLQTHPDPKDWAAFTLIGEGE